MATWLSYTHVRTAGEAVVMPGVSHVLIIDALIPGIDVAVVRAVFGETIMNVRASDLIPLDVFLGQAMAKSSD
jgi:hypothetical protein